jgi:hypothetical protein
MLVAFRHKAVAEGIVTFLLCRLVLAVVIAIVMIPTALFEHEDD